MPVYLCHAEDPDIEGANGAHMKEKGSILLNQDLSANELYETLIHEVLHVIDERSSLSFKLAGETKTTLEAWADDHGHAETLVRTLSPALVGLYVNGKKLLRLPKPQKAKKK